MFVYIRKHQQWLWTVIMGAVIVSFVWYFNPGASRGSGSGGGAGDNVGSINGRPVSRKAYLDAYQEAQLRYFFSYGQWPEQDEAMRQMGIMPRETRNRLILGEKLRELNIQVSEEAIAQWIVEAFSDRETKAFRKEIYDQFVKERLPQFGLRAADLERFVRREVGIQHLATVAGAAGKLVTPQEAEVQYRREHEEVEAEIVLFSATNHLSSVTVDPAALARFYTNQASMYRVPERLQVAYVAFASSNYFPQADEKVAQDTNLTQRIDQIYAQRGAKFFTDASGAVMPEPAAKDRIKTEIREAYAMLEARKEAYTFANELLELQPRQMDNLERLAAAKGVLSKVSQPFTQSSPPEDLNVSMDVAKVAFQLTPEEPFLEQPVDGEGAVYVIGLKKKLPSELPPLDAIRDRVTEDHRRSQAQALARGAGTSFHNLLTNTLAQGKTFQAACEQAKLAPIKLPPFSQTTSFLKELDGKVDISSVKNAAFALAPGQSSPFTSTRDGGFVLALKSRLPVSEAKVKGELLAYLTTLRRNKQNEAFGEWFSHEAELAKVSLPGDKESPQ